MFLPPDVLFRDEFTLHHSTPDLYIGLAPTNEPLFFLSSMQRQRQKGERSAQFGASIKMQIVGKDFSVVTMEALSLRRPKTATYKTQRNPEFFSSRHKKTFEKKWAKEFCLEGFFSRLLCLFVSKSHSLGGDAEMIPVLLFQKMSINQSIGRRDAETHTEGMTHLSDDYAKGSVMKVLAKLK